MNEGSEHPPADNEPVMKETETDEPVPWYEQATPNVLMAKTNDQLTYVYRRSCHVDRCHTDKIYSCRSKNVICWLWLIFMMPLLVSGHENGKEGRS